MNPNLYDLLDVEETASGDEIRAAWKSAIADLEPSDRRFRAYNDAAGVLLDPDKRAAYDESLAAERAEDGAADVPTGRPVPEPAPETVAPTVAPAPVLVATPPAEAEAPGESSAEPGAGRSGPALWLVGVALVLALCSVVLAIWVVHQAGGSGSTLSPSQVNADDTTLQSEVADKIVPAMSYDYRTLPADLKKLQAYMTPAMAAKQARAWKSLSQEAAQQHAVVVSHTPTDAPGTGLTRISDDGTRAVVVAFIDQDVRKLATAPFTLKMWATFVLVKDGSTGTWLVDNICTDTTCS